MVDLLIPALLIPWACVAALAGLVRPYRPWMGWATVAMALASFGAAVGLWIVVLRGDVAAWGDGHVFRVDGLSALLAFCIATVAGTAMWFAPAGRQGDTAEASKFRLYGAVFVFAMLMAVVLNNVALMWVAIEATTVMSALLIPLHRSKASVEASWKYLLIGSVGIALAFAGTVLAYFDFVSLLGRRGDALSWTLLRTVAPSLHPEVLKLAFVFLLVGYGTKAGLAPMHTWLPDAYAEAPAALSALMSGVLAAVAQYAVLRWKAVVDLAVGPGFTDQLLVPLGILSLAIGALGLVVQRHYKRMLAYSSVEHTGLICLGFTFGPAGVFASLLHMLNHSLAKSVSFFASGRILDRYGTTDAEQVTGLIRTMPGTGTIFAAGLVALMGLPPFGLLISEYLLFRAGFASGHLVTTALALVLTGIAFIGLGHHLLRMVFGPPSTAVASGEADRWMLAPLAAYVAAMVLLGLVLPTWITDVLADIVKAVTA